MKMTSSDLDRLLAQQIPKTEWCIDQWGNLRQINVETDVSEVVMHLCEMSKEKRDKFAQQLIAQIARSQEMCDLTDPIRRKN